MAVRRQLLNNRLTVRLGTDIPLSGGNSGTQAYHRAPTRPATSPAT
ncbi:MAG: hypothetical protein WKG07_29715 [Hymenobacter sp.]